MIFALGILKLVPFRAWAVIAIACALGAALFMFAQSERRLGAQKLENRIEEQNKEADDNADQAELRVRNCYLAGRVWNHGTCNDP